MTEKRSRYEPPIAFNMNYGGSEIVRAQACLSGNNPSHAQCKFGSLADNLCWSGNMAGGQCKAGGTAVRQCRQGSMVG